MKSQVITTNAQALNIQPVTIQKESRMKKSRPIYLLAVVLIAMSTILSQGAYAAGPLTPVQLANEVMMHTQGEDTEFMAAQIGVDPNSPLTYTTYVDPKGQSFTFSLQSGSTYLGRAITLIAAGTLNPSTQAWSISTAGTYGGVRWTATGTLTSSPAPNAQSVSFASNTQFSFQRLRNDIQLFNGTSCTPLFYYSGYFGQSTEICQHTYNGQPVGPTWLASDGWGPVYPWYNWWWTLNFTPWQFSVAGQGSTPQSGGNGFFSTVIGPAQPACISCNTGD